MKSTIEQNRKQKDRLDYLEVRIALRSLLKKENPLYKVGYLSGYSAGYVAKMKMEKEIRYEDI
jgi:hypothetical protein